MSSETGTPGEGNDYHPNSDFDKKWRSCTRRSALSFAVVATMVFGGLSYAIKQKQPEKVAYYENARQTLSLLKKEQEMIGNRTFFEPKGYDSYDTDMQRFDRMLLATHENLGGAIDFLEKNVEYMEAIDPNVRDYQEKLKDQNHKERRGFNITAVGLLGWMASSLYWGRRKRKLFLESLEEHTKLIDSKLR